MHSAEKVHDTTLDNEKYELLCNNCAL